MGDNENIDESPSDGDYLVETDYTEQSPSTAVVEALSAVEGVDPTAADFTLYEKINPDALNSLFETRTPDEEKEDTVVVIFSVKDFTVKITSGGTLTIEEFE